MRENRWRSGRRVAAAGCVASALFMTALSGPAAAAAGDLDPSFGSGGFAFASSPGTYSGARAVAVDPKGRIVAAGFAHPDGTIAQSVMVARFDGERQAGQRLWYGRRACSPISRTASTRPPRSR